MNPAILLFSTLLALPAALTDPAPTYQKELPEPAALARGTASRYANLAPATCKKQLAARKVAVEFVAPAPGIANPVRIVGPLGGVQFQTGPKKSPFGVADCRLVLTWLDLVPLLREHKVASVRIDNFYRKGARLPTRRAKKSQHAYGLATDLTSVTLDDGTLLEVEKDFHGKLGQDVCGSKALVQNRDPKGVLLRNLVCDIARTGAFHHILTPNANLAHRDHLHLDIARDCAWFSVK